MCRVEDVHVNDVLRLEPFVGKAVLVDDLCLVDLLDSPEPAGMGWGVSDSVHRVGFWTRAGRYGKAA